MGFTPTLIFADICLIISIGIGLLIQANNFPNNVKIGLIILAGIFLIISISINAVSAVKRRNERK
ncbi:hypothetical protein PL11_001085 [Lentilactobacillus curieae]|uniref:Uncharacterized protein n=1 Tax=Lentilactobacillus curieae TaxID=1138822 RepID=A0A1S6QKZ0_9LACO|nr:hypothetical protein PL11_001085 [Lentilactobacillus curieae]